MACVTPPAVSRGPVEHTMAFLAGFDMQKLGEGFVDFMVGGVSGAIAQTIVFPIDLAKTRIQDEVCVDICVWMPPCYNLSLFLCMH